MKNLVLIILIFGGNYAYAGCQFTTDCSYGSYCFKLRGEVEGECRSKPGNFQTVPSRVKTCSTDFDCGISQDCFKPNTFGRGICVEERSR